MLRASIKHSLGQFSIAPSLDFNKNPEMDPPYDLSKKSPIVPNVEVDKNFNPFQENKKQKPKFNTFTSKNTVSNANSWEAIYVGLKSDQDDTDFDSIVFESDEVTGSLFENEENNSNNFIFQFQNKYIMSPIKSGIMIIHQNLAHQRILYEGILKNITVKEATSQQLLFPLQLIFSKLDLEILKSIQQQLEHTGFSFSSFKEDTIEIIGIPVAVKESEIKNILDCLVNDIRTEVPDPGFSQNDLLAKSLAKSLAVKTGKPLNEAELEHLVHQLFACKEPTKSPTNQSVLMILNASDIDKKFI